MTTAIVTEMTHVTTLSDAALGDLLWDAWTATRNAHPTRLRTARARLHALSAEAHRRGFLVTTDRLYVGQIVTETGTTLTGIVVGLTDDAAIVSWGRPRTPGVPGSDRTQFGATALLVGALSAA